MSNLLAKMNPQSRLLWIIQETANRTGDRIFGRIRDAIEPPASEVNRDEIENLIATLDMLARFRSWIEARMGGGKRNRRRLRPYLHHLDGVRLQQLGRLRALGVRAIDTDSTVDMRQHDICTAIPTTDPNQHGQIAEVWREGYVDSSGTVIRQASVVVRRFHNKHTNGKENAQ